MESRHPLISCTPDNLLDIGTTRAIIPRNHALISYSPRIPQEINAMGVLIDLGPTVTPYKLPLMVPHDHFHFLTPDARHELFPLQQLATCGMGNSSWIRSLHGLLPWLPKLVPTTYPSAR